MSSFSFLSEVGTEQRSQKAFPKNFFPSLNPSKLAYRVRPAFLLLAVRFFRKLKLVLEEKSFRLLNSFFILLGPLQHCFIGKKAHLHCSWLASKNSDIESVSTKCFWSKYFYISVLKFPKFHQSVQFSKIVFYGDVLCRMWMLCKLVLNYICSCTWEKRDSVLCLCVNILSGL